MRDWRNTSLIRRCLGGMRRHAQRRLSQLGLYEQVTPAEREVAQGEEISFLAARSGQLSPEVSPQHRLEYLNPRPESEHAEDLLYTRTGIAWTRGRVVERYCMRPPYLRENLLPPSRARSESIDSAVIVEPGHYPYTYGDWLHACFGTILCAGKLESPLLLPESVVRKPYVARDLKAAGIDFIPVTRTYAVKNARILRIQAPMGYWTASEVNAYQRTFAPERRTPDPGSISYLGRFNLGTEAVARRFPSETVGDVVRGMGGEVIRQEILNPEISVQLGSSMETVIADHGSGVLNILHWKPKNIIELVVNDWWCNNNLFVAHAMGIRNYAVVDVDGLSRPRIEQVIRACLDKFAAVEA